MLPLEWEGKANDEQLCGLCIAELVEPHQGVDRDG